MYSEVLLPRPDPVGIMSHGRPVFPESYRRLHSIEKFSFSHYRAPDRKLEELQNGSGAQLEQLLDLVVNWLALMD